MRIVDSDVNAAQILDREVVNVSAGEGSVGDENHTVVERDEFGAGYVDFADYARKSLSLNKIAYFERAEDENHHATSEILQRARECHTYSQRRQAKRVIKPGLVLFFYSSVKDRAD